MITVKWSDLPEEDRKSVKEHLNELRQQAISNMLDPTSHMTEEARKNYGAKVMQKLKSGKRLSTDEMNYLKIHNPMMYRTAKRVEMEKEQLEESLKHCKSKEEANDQIFGAISRVSSSDPDREYLLAGLHETAKNFRQNSCYARLPETVEEGQKAGKSASGYEGEEAKETKTSYTPLIEVMETLPKFDVIQ